MDHHQLITFILFFPGFLFSLSVHEAAHGWVADRLGDGTARSQGRVTMNPLPHIDLLGTLLLPTVGFFVGGFIIGWGKPVPVDYRNLKNWKRDGFFIAGAGPLSNVVLALIFAGVLHAVVLLNPSWTDPQQSSQGFLILLGLLQVFYLNLALAFFNLIPIHPLDGGKMLYGLLPQPWADQFNVFVTRYGVVLLMLFLVTGFYKVIIGYPMNFFAELLL